MLLLAIKITLIRAKVTGTLGIKGVVKGLIAREVNGIEIEVKVVEVEAIVAKTNHVRTLRSRSIIPSISC